MKLSIDVDQENDSRWIAELPDMPGTMAYGASRLEAIAKAKALAFRVMAERLENGEPVPQIRKLFSVVS